MAVAETAGVSTEGVLLTLGTGGEMPLAELLEQTSEDAVAVAWGKGEIEFGRTKYVVTGNPETAVTTHNGVVMPPPAVVIEGGIEWPGPGPRCYQPFHKIKAHKLPVCPVYQKYQLEVCTNEQSDAWDWLKEGEAAGRRKTRYARREIDRKEAESLFEFRVRLTEKGTAALN